MAVTAFVDVVCDRPESEPDLLGNRECGAALRFQTGSTSDAIRWARKRGWSVSKKAGQPYRVRCPIHTIGGQP